MAAITTTPEKVELTAGPDVLAKMNQVNTDPVSLEDLVAGDNEREIRLQLPAGVTSPVTTVKVKIQVRKINQP